MSKEKLGMVDIGMQTEDLSTARSSSSSNNSAEKERDSLSVQVHDTTKNVFHEKAYKYLDREEAKYREGINTIYDYTESMMEAVRKAPNFHIGLKSAIDEYKNISQDIHDMQKKDFILVQFLEEFYEGFTVDGYYSVADREANFQDALNIISENHLLGNIFDDYQE